MAEIQTIIGSLPVLRGEYDGETSYYRDNQVTMYGSTFQSIADDNVGYPPAEERDDGKVYAINTDKWVIVANALGAYNAGSRIDKLAENTEIKNEDGKTIKTPFREIESPEFLHCIVDAEGHFMFGIQFDGSIEWGKGIPAPIRARLQDIINQMQQNNKNITDTIYSIKEYLKLNLNGKVISILGDSLSTYSGYIPTGNATYYPSSNNDIGAVEQTWWMQLITESNAILGINNSYSGAKVSGNEDSSYTKRATNLGNPDYIIIHGGTNDIWQNVTVGSLHFELAEESLNINEFADSYDLLVRKCKSLYPYANIILVIPHVVSAEYTTVINEIAKHYNLFGVVDLHNCSFVLSNGHYQVVDMSTVAEAVAKTLYVDKNVLYEEGKSLTPDEINNSFEVIENDEFIHAMQDAEGRILFGIYRATGKPYYPLNEMYHVEQNEEFFALWLDAADHVLLGIRRDGQIIGEIHAVNALKLVIAQLQSDLTSLQEKVGTIDTSLQELLSVFSLQDTPEYLAVETDADGNVLSATNADGSHYIHNAKSETIPEEFSHIEDPEGRIEITADSENKVLGQRYADGERYEHKMKIDELNLGDLNMGENVSNKILQLVDSQPKQVETKKWHLPKYGTVNIKQETFYLTANDGYTDKSGIYPIVINEDTQENAQKALTVLKFFVKSTLTDNGDGTYSKKENSVGLDFYVPSQVTIVDGVAYVTSSLTKSDTDGTYSVNDESIKLTKIVDKPTIGAWKVDKKTEHQCTVDIDFGHYLKGTFSIGVKYQGSSTLYNRKRNFRFTFYKNSKFSKKDKIKIGEMVRTSGFNLKANYSDQSRIKEFIMNRVLMEIWGDREEYHNYPWDSEDEPYSGATGMIKGFPVRVNIGGEFYGLDIFGLKKDDKNYLLDGDESGMIVSGTRGNSADPNNWTGAKPTDWEDEMNDELTESNISALTAFFSFINSENFTKENVPQRMSVIDWIDYFIGLQVFLMRDNTCRNMILYAGKDKKKFYPFFYDLDLSWNFYASQPDIDIMTDSYAADMSLWENFKALYGDEIANRYAYLRGTILNSDYFYALYKDIASNIPQEDVSLEYKKWGRGDITYMNNLLKAMDKRLEWLDKEYFKV